MQETDPNFADDDISADEALNEESSASATDSALEQGLEMPTAEQHAGQLQADLEQAADRTLRLQAEMENLRSRTSREIAETRRFAAMPLLRDLLPALDNISRALEAAEGTEAAAGLLEGFRMVKEQLLGVLVQHQCTEIAALGEPFDPNFHEAILQQPSDDVPAQSVCLVTQSGYQLHDRVVRPSQVIVSTGPAEASATDSDSDSDSDNG